jgi:iron complex outermembrane recepter protein
VINAAEATIQGIELEATFRPIDRFTLSGFWGYTDASFDKFIDPFTGADLSDQDFARVPKNNWRVAGTVDLVRSQNLGDISFTAAYAGRDSYLGSDNAVLPSDLIPSHDQLDLYLKADNVGNMGLDVTLFAKNVTDQTELQPLASVFPSLGFAAVVAGPPRQFGIQLRYDFGRD